MISLARGLEETTGECPGTGMIKSGLPWPVAGKEMQCLKSFKLCQPGSFMNLLTIHEQFIMRRAWRN
jgi:hypothetical protein